jgi:Leucine-rich repeat (LRR) protein
MSDNEDHSLISLPDGSLANTAAGAKRIMSAMVGEMLALTRQEQTCIQPAKRRIGAFELCAADYRQILLWAEALALEPEEVIRRLSPWKWQQTVFENGKIVKLDLDLHQLPLTSFRWVANLEIEDLRINSWEDAPVPIPPLFPFLPRLRTLHCSHFKCDALDLSPVSALTELHCDNNQLRILNLSTVPKLLELWCHVNELAELKLAGVSELRELWCGGNKLTELSLSSVPELNYLSCENNQLMELDLSGVSKLTCIECQGGKLTQLDLSNVPKLSYLSCENNQLAELDLSKLTALTCLWCGSNNLIGLDLSSVPALEFLSCEQNPIEVLDIRPVQNLQTLRYSVASTRLIQRSDQHF